MVTVKVGTGTSAGKISFYNGSVGRTDMIADISGYYRSGTRASTGAFVPLAPTRILDSRSHIGFSGRVPAVSAISVRVSGNGVVPVTASAVVLNVTVTNQVRSGYLVAFPSDRSAPGA